MAMGMEYVITDNNDNKELVCSENYTEIETIKHWLIQEGYNISLHERLATQKHVIDVEQGIVRMQPV